MAKNLNVPGISLNKFSKAVLLNSRNVRWKEIMLLRFRCSFNPVLCCRNQRRKCGFSPNDVLFFSFLLDVCQAWRGPRPGSTCNGDIREGNESRVTRGTVWSKIPCSQEIYYNNGTNILMPLLMLTLWQKIITNLSGFFFTNMRMDLISSFCHLLAMITHMSRVISRQGWGGGQKNSLVLTWISKPTVVELSRQIFVFFVL